MGLLYNATSAVNGYNADGHYVRAQPLSSSTHQLLAELRGRRLLVGALPARRRERCRPATARRWSSSTIVAKALQADRLRAAGSASPVAGLWSLPDGDDQVRRRRGRETSFLQNPVLIGALTVLVVIVAVALAYKANTGLPFTPTYNLHVQMRDAAELQTGDDVNEGGALVGLVERDQRHPRPAGKPVAERQSEAVQEHRAAAGRHALHRSAEGLDRRQVPGDRPRRLAPRPAPTARPCRSVRPAPTTDLDQVLNMFSPPTRKGIQQSTIGFGEAVAGRGYDINRAIGKFLPLVSNLLPVTTNLASPSTDLAGFLRGLESLSGALAPVAQTQATLFTNLNTTFSALASVAPVAAGHGLGDAAGVRGGDRPVPGDRAVPDRHRVAADPTATRRSRRFRPARRCSRTCSARACRTCRRRSRSTGGWCRCRRRSAVSARRPPSSRG